MEALVNAAYDRISEDIILLYDAFQAYEEAHPRPPLSALLEAIRQVLKEEDKGRKAWSVWNSISREDLRSMGGARLEAATGALSESKTIYNKTKNNDDVAPSESGLREMIRVLLTSIMSDLAVLPFWTVKLSSVAQRGRNDALWPFKGYMVSFQSIIEDEGWSGLFKGAVPVCIGGLLRYLRRNRRLYSDYYSKTTQRLTAKLVMKEPGGLKAHDPEILVQTYEGVGVKALWAALLHPFDLIATRMITTSGEKYRNVTNSLKTIIKERGWSGLLLGVRSSLIRSILPHRSIYTMGVPFLVKTRRMLDGMDDVYRTGMGGSLEILRDILRVQGIQGLFSGLRATQPAGDFSLHLEPCAEQGCLFTY